MKLLKMMIVLALPLCIACRSAQTPAPVPEPATGPANEPQLPPRPPLEMTIKPAEAAALGGQRVPLEFTIRNTGGQTVHACLTSGRVVHFWGIDKQYAYTVAEQKSEQAACEEAFDLAPHAQRSWTEEIAVPAIAASSAKIVGFAQIGRPDGCQSHCEPVWLSASFSPFKIQDAGGVGPLDLRTGVGKAATVALVRPAVVLGPQKQ